MNLATGIVAEKTGSQQKLSLASANAASCLLAAAQYLLLSQSLYCTIFVPAKIRRPSESSSVFSKYTLVQCMHCRACNLL